MKVKDGFLLREIMNEFLIVPIGDRLADFNGLISLNESGKLLWQSLNEEKSEQELVDIILENYDIDEDTALKDVKIFIKTMKDNDLLV